METKKQETLANEAWEKLVEMSKQVKPLVEAGTFLTTNNAIMETIYKDANHKVFKSFSQWKAQGKQVKEGAKPFLLWSKPQGEETLEKENGEETFKLFSTVHLFSNAQVEDIPQA